MAKPTSINIGHDVVFVQFYVYMLQLDGPFHPFLRTCYTQMLHVKSALSLQQVVCKPCPCDVSLPRSLESVFCAGSEAVVAVDPACTGLAAKPLCLASCQGIWNQKKSQPQKDHVHEMKEGIGFFWHCFLGCESAMHNTPLAWCQSYTSPTSSCQL